MNTQQLTQLSSQLDGALTQFGLTANASGEYPWQQQQREKRTGRRIKQVAGAGVLAGAGIYGHQSVMNRAQAAGPVRASDAYKAVGSEVADKAKAVGGALAGKAKAAAAPAVARAGAYGQKLKSATKAGMAGSAGMGWKKPKLGLGKAAMAALKGVRFSAAERLVELEAQLDGALVEFGAGTMGAVIGGARAGMTKKDGESTPEYLQRTTKGAVKGAVVGTGAKYAGAAAVGGLMLGNRKFRMYAGRNGYRKEALGMGKELRKMKKGA